jgi:hypothetical protein
VDSCEPCPPDVRRPLQEDIDLASRQYTQNDEAATAKTLTAFVANVERGMQSGAVPATVGRQLIADATPLINEFRGAKAQTKTRHDSQAKSKTPHDSGRRGKHDHARSHRHQR